MRFFTSMERSVIKLNVVAELQPSFPPTASAETISQAMKAIEGFPYVCFVEKTSGLLVLITFSGYCLKFQLEVEQEEEIAQPHDRYDYLYNVKTSQNTVQRERARRDTILSTAREQQSEQNKDDRQQAPEAQKTPKDQPKRAAEFKAPTLRLKHKIDEFFEDLKAESKKRIEQRA